MGGEQRRKAMQDAKEKRKVERMGDQWWGRAGRDLEEEMAQGGVTAEDAKRTGVRRQRENGKG